METRSVSSLQFSWEQLTCLRQVEREMNEVRELSLRPSHQMEALPSPLSFRAKPRDLQFRGSFLEMFSTEESWAWRPTQADENGLKWTACKPSTGVSTFQGSRG